MKIKRILWLLNHETLSKFELPLIKDLGFEIFTPKVLPKEILQVSGSVNYEYDKTLSIPREKLDLLNKFDFYKNDSMPFYIENILNSYFNTAIVMFDFNAIRSLVYHFKGNIFARAFGISDQKFTYTNITQQLFDDSFFYKLEQIKDRFWFSQCYENISKVESGIYKEKAVFMPLGLPPEFYNIEDQWSGEDEKLLFFCTRINYNQESKNIYNKFKDDFKDFDFYVAGNQPVPVEDERVLGFMEREELNELYRKCRVMYYHSINPRHLHYHPLEAMIAGMPVIYMEGSLLDVLGGARQTGRSKNIKEAREKVGKVLSGDKQFITDILIDQKEILYKFSYEYNLDKWNSNFLPLVRESKTINIIEPRSVALFISDNQKINIRNWIVMALSVNMAIQKIDRNYNVKFNIPVDMTLESHESMEMYNSGISVGKYEMKIETAKEIKDSLSLMFDKKQLWYEKYAVPVDNIKNFTDSELWFFLDDDLLDFPIAPIKPYGIYIENICDRYYEAISEIRIQNYKRASLLFTFSEITKRELIKHLGLDENKIFVIPLEYTSNNDKRYDLIPTNDYVLMELDLNKPKDIIKLIDIIDDYYNLYRSTVMLKIFFNNYDKEKNGYIIDKINDFIQKTSYLRNSISLHVNLQPREYNHLYVHASKIIIPHNIKNIFYKMVNAASYSKRMVLNDFKAYRDYERIIGMKFEYNNFINDDKAIFDCLKEHQDSLLHDNTMHGSPKIDIKEMEQVWRGIL